MVCVDVLTFQPTHPSRGATLAIATMLLAVSNFNPRTPHGVRLYQLWPFLRHGYFNPRTPHGVRPRGWRKPRPTDFYFNPRTPHGVRPGQRDGGPAGCPISTHAPLTGCDILALLYDVQSGNFNPRTPHGVRLDVDYVPVKQETFQPTHPSRGATSCIRICKNSVNISTHAPLTGCDYLGPRQKPGQKVFQPTHPSRGATTPCRDYPTTAEYFNPRTPHGVRPE